MMAFAIGNTCLGAHGPSTRIAASRRGNVRMTAEKTAEKTVEKTDEFKSKIFITAPAWTIPEAIPTIEGDVSKPMEPFVRRRRDTYVNYDIPKLIARVNYHMFGPAFVSAFERTNLSEGESYIRGGNMTIKDYVKFVAMSPAWRARFFDNRPSMYSAVEVCYRKFYGTNPTTPADSLAKSDMYHSGGYEAFIESFFDDKYDQLWGDWMVPEWQNDATTERNSTMANYVDLFDVVRGPSASANIALTRQKFPSMTKTAPVVELRVEDLDLAGFPLPAPSLE